MPPEQPGNVPPAHSAPAADSVTVSITRTVDPNHTADVTPWVQTGMDLAGRYPGFLGSGWVRAGQESWTWHMLYRFANVDLLHAWENSSDRAGWLNAGHHLVLESRVERRTGIEGWFDAPEADSSGSAAFQPPRWKQAISIWLGFFPVNLTFTLLVTWLVPGWTDLATVAKVLLTTLALTPLMAYWVLPFVTRTLRPWLLRRPAG